MHAPVLDIRFKIILFLGLKKKKNEMYYLINSNIVKKSFSPDFSDYFSNYSFSLFFSLYSIFHQHENQNDQAFHRNEDVDQ